MNIGFDLDKIFIDYPPFIPDTLINRLYKKKSDRKLLYRIPNKPEQFLRKVSHWRFFRPMIKRNIAILNSLPKEQHKLYLISSRFGFLEKMTQKLMRRQGFDKIFDGMYFNFSNKQPHIFKSEVIKRLNIDMYIDDDLPLLNFVAKQNKTTRFYWLNQQRQTGSLTRNIIAISNLTDILKYIPTS